jgi:hypothetical protein
VFTGKRKGHASSCASSSSSKVLQAVSSRANFLLRSFLAGGVAEEVEVEEALAAQAWTVDEGGLWEEEVVVEVEEALVVGVGVVVELALPEAALVELEEVTVEVLSMS